MDTVENIENKVADLIGESIPERNLSIFDLIPTQIANDIKDLCNYTCEGEYLHHQEWLEVNDEDSDGHIYQTAERIREWINKEVPF